MPAGKLEFEIELGASFRRQIYFVVAKDGTPWPLSNVLEIRAGGKVSHRHVQFQWYISNLPITEINSIAKGTVSILGDNVILLTIPASETNKMSNHSGRWNLEIEYTDGTVLRPLEGRYKASYQIVD